MTTNPQTKLNFNIILNHFFENDIPLTSHETDIFNAINDPSIKIISPEILFSKLEELIYMVFFNAGFSLKGDTEEEKANFVINLCQKFSVELLSDFPSFTLMDIELSLRRGVCNHYDEYKTISVSMMVLWLNAYLKEKQLLIAKIHKVQDLKNTKPNYVLNAENRSKIFSECALNSFENYKTKGIFLDAGNVIYDFLDKRNIINYSKDEKIEFLSVAKWRIRAKWSTNSAVNWSSHSAANWSTYSAAKWST